MEILEKIDKQLDEVYQMVKLEGLPNIVMKGSEGAVRMQLKKKLKRPDDIVSIEKVTKGEMKKYFRELGAGKGEEESVDEANPDVARMQRAKKDWSHYVTELQRALRQTKTKVNPIRDLLRKAGLDYQADQTYLKITGIINDAEKEINKELAKVFRGRFSAIKQMREARDFSNAHYALAKGQMYGDTQSIYILDELGGRIRHLGFGDFGTGNPIKLPRVGEVRIEYVRIDGSATGKKLEDKGFVGRPHSITFPELDGTKHIEASKELAKIYKKKGAVEVKI